MAAGMGNWDEFVRTGGWDVGAGHAALGSLAAAGVEIRYALHPFDDRLARSQRRAG
jgi:hypothetical protein